MATALAVRHGVFGRATLNRLGRPLATHAHREGHVIVTLKGTGGAIELDGAMDRDGVDEKRRSARKADALHGGLDGNLRDDLASGGSRLPLEPGHAVLISSWRPHRFVPGPRPSEFLTLYIAPEWFAALEGSPDAGNATTDALFFGAGRVAMSEALCAMADETAALLAADARRGSGGRRAMRHGGGDADPGGAIEASLAGLTTALHARSWGNSPHLSSDVSPDRSCGFSRDPLRDPSRAPIRVDPPSRRVGGEGAIRPGEVRAPVGMPARTIGDFRIRRALRLMREAVGEGCEVDLDRTARESGLSRPHFFKLFRAHVGVTPGTFVNALKMEASYERLSAGDETVTAIGLDLGFASQASFTRFFIAQSGIAPSDYRHAVAARGIAGAARAHDGLRNEPHNETVGYA